jgi:phage gpG-like protein
MSKEIISLTGNMSRFDATMARLRIKDYSPVMQKISDRYLKTMARRGWSGSGLHSVSGELEKAITPFHGKRSAGVGIRTTKGKDKVLPKAITHTYGARKGSFPQGPKGRRSGRKSPWGRIPARPFMPAAMPGSYQRGAEQLIMDFIDDRL